MNRNEKIIVNVSSYERIDSLILSLKSIYDQCDIINVCLNNHYGDIPSYLLNPKINLTFTDNSKGDAFKFLNLINSDGYYFTIDDDLIYPKNYVEYMISKCKEYNNKSIITLHGRNFGSLPISSYYRSAIEIYSCLKTVKKDINVQYGGTGVMCFNTDLFKVGIDYFSHPNMADVWIGKYAKENKIPIICVKHDEGYIKYIEQKNTIYNTESKNDNIQTKLVNGELDPALSIIIPTFNTEKYLESCLDSIVKSIKNLECEILVGIDGCMKTLEFVKKNEFDSRIKFFYFGKNSGPYILKNTLVKESKSENILFFDSDDIMDDTMISEIYPKINNYDFIKPMYSEFKQGEKINKVTKTNKYGEGVFAINRKLFLEMNGFEPWRCAADSDFMGRLYKNNKKFSYTDNVVFYRRVHPNSLTQSPETSSWSKLRAKYFAISKSKKKFGPLPNLVTESFEIVDSQKFINQKLPKFEEKIEKKEKILNEIFLPKLNQTKYEPENKVEVNYDVINQVTQKKGVYTPQKSQPVRPNKPTDRNELQKLKNGQNSQLLEKMFKVKPNRRNGLPNIF